MKTKYTKKQIEESIKYWKKQLKMMNEANADEVLVYYDNLDAVSRALKPLLDKFIRFKDDGSKNAAGLSNYWNEMAWIPLAVSKLIVENCPEHDKVELADKIVKLGAGYMI